MGFESSASTTVLDVGSIPTYRPLAVVVTKGKTQDNPRSVVVGGTITKRVKCGEEPIDEGVIDLSCDLFIAGI